MTATPVTPGTSAATRSRTSESTCSASRSRAPTPMWYTGGIIYPDGSAEFDQTYEVDGATALILEVAVDQV